MQISKRMESSQELERFFNEKFENLRLLPRKINLKFVCEVSMKIEKFQKTVRTSKTFPRSTGFFAKKFLVA